MDAYRQTVNNSTFENEQDISKAVSDWTNDYNKKHRFKASTIGLQKEPHCKVKQKAIDFLFAY